MIKVNHPELWRHLLPVPVAEGHKYSRGAALILGGPVDCMGAAKLAAKAAQRFCGLVAIAAREDALPYYGMALESVMVRAYGDVAAYADLASDQKYQALLLGPGAGVNDATLQKVKVALDSRKAVVLDADALTVFEGRSGELKDSIAGPVVLTPHEGEWLRLCAAGGFVSAKASREERVLATADYFNSVLVLKGAQTLIAAPDGQIVIQEKASPWLATAGSGDVLAGIVTGLMAGGMLAFEATCAGVWLHAAAADALGAAFVAEELTNVLWRVVSEE